MAEHIYLIHICIDAIYICPPEQEQKGKRCRCISQAQAEEKWWKLLGVFI